jgi:hypothetical protein
MRSQVRPTRTELNQLEDSMKTQLLAAIALILVPAAVHAEDISGKAMHDHPGVTGAGSTANPTAKPNSGSLSEKAMQAQPGVNNGGGNTVNPTAKAEDGNLTTKAMKDQLKN